ncbi:putative oxidoreductase [Microlunatus phosphovorus NM-1]|uniref:Putative oxidoreductase n=2 Tax=Microlunatus phosphovorus TaxID=29405 RepID=F5XJA1_MICPN|nr:putative oxidoreductase [Microlunatus phosphovorus NM-1]
MGDGRTTVVMSFHRVGEEADFAAFAERVAADAAEDAGFFGWQASVLASPLLDWAIAVRFREESSVHDWLDRARDLITGSGYQRASIEFIIDGAPRTPGVVVVNEAVESGREAAFVETAEHLAQLERAQPGWEGSSVFPPGGILTSWSSVIRFRTESQLEAWLASPALTEALPRFQAHLSEEAKVTTATTFGSTLRVTDGKAVVTPDWKTALAILLVLYPTVMLLAKFVGPTLSAIAPQPWLGTFLNLAISIVLLTWVLMPLSARLLRRWLDPVEGAGVKVSLLGAAGVCAGYLLLFLIFGTVGFLQL